MTYCVGVKLDEGLIFASDSRTHAGVDNYAKFCKMTVFERAGDRVLVLGAVHCRAARSQACRTARLNRSQALCGWRRSHSARAPGSISSQLRPS